MLHLSLSKCVPTDVGRPSQRAVETAAMFGLGLDHGRTMCIVPPCDAPLPDVGIVFITGPSGGGKSTLLRLIAAGCRSNGRRVTVLNEIPEPDDRPLVDLVGHDVESACRVLSMAGLGDAFTMLRRPGELSDGQRYRFAIAQAMDRFDRDRTDVTVSGSNAHSASASTSPARPSCDAATASQDRRANDMIIIADEFGSGLDRITAKMIARNIRRWIDVAGHCLVCATSHDDLLEPLHPDVLIWKGLGAEMEIVVR